MIKAFQRAFRAAVTWIKSRYESGQRFHFGERSYLPGFVQDQKFDADQATRWELVRKSRYFERNNAIVNRLADLFEQFTVGPNGLEFIPSSSDEEWNQRAKVWWDEWCQFCDLTSQMPFGSLQSLVARSLLIDGEIFILKTRGDETPRRPRIQLVEGHRVGTPPQHHDREGKTIFDGVEVDPRGRPIAYYFKRDDDTYRRVPADMIIHVFEPSRPGQYRGLPYLYPVMNDLHDLDDLQILEMKAAKDAAEVSNIVENPAGELNQSQMRRSRFSATTENSQGVETVETRTRFLQKVFGGRTIALRTGEKLTQFRSERPSVATREYWDYLTSKVCAGVGISKLLVFPWSIQGTVARADLDIANAFFRARTSILVSKFTQVYSYVIGWAVTNELELADPPPDWRMVTTRAPRAVNVDVGRNSAAMLSELEAGTRTYQGIYAELGEDYRVQLRQRASEASYIRKLAEEFGVTPAEISKASGEAIQADMQANQAMENAEDDEEEEEELVTE